MYSKEQASKLREAFWTAFGQYISLQPSAEGEKINWINYKTGMKYVNFRMQADPQRVSIAIELSQPDPGMQELVFNQFCALRNILHTSLNEEWQWELHGQDQYGKTVSRISATLEGPSIFRQADWPAIISFLKPRMIALDDFWSLARHSFDLFR